MYQTHLEDLIEEHKQAEREQAERDRVAAMAALVVVQATSGPQVGADACSAIPAADTTVTATSLIEAVTTETSSILCEEAVDFQNPTGEQRSLLRTVQHLLRSPEGQKSPAVCLCGYARGALVQVHLADHLGSPVAGLKGVYRCGNGHVCPICAPRSAADRADRYRQIDGAMDKQTGRLLTLTFTIPHKLGDRLNDLMEAVKSASTGARSGQAWQYLLKEQLKGAGVLVDAHIRWSPNSGWHFHQHLTVICMITDNETITEAAHVLIAAYIKRLKKAGYDADPDRQWVAILRDDPEHTYTYPADHHRPPRVLDGEDVEPGDSLSPMELADRAGAGDAQAAKLFREYAMAVKGTRNAILTKSMAKALGIDQAGTRGPVFDETTKLGTMPSLAWARLLDKSLTTTFFSRVESAGRRGWQVVRWWALDITGLAPKILDVVAEEIVVLLQAWERLDGSAQALAEGEIKRRIKEWRGRHGTPLIADTIQYAYAHRHLLPFDEQAVDDLVSTIEAMADKMTRRQRDAATKAIASASTVSAGYTPTCHMRETLSPS